jgi:hypothetical protein
MPLGGEDQAIKGVAGIERYPRSGDGVGDWEWRRTLNRVGLGPARYRGSQEQRIFFGSLLLRLAERLQLSTKLRPGHQ